MAEKTETNPKGAGAPLGNQNSSKSNRLFTETIKRLATQSEGEYNRMIAQALIDKAISGDMAAIKEYGDRIDGKAIATQELTGPDGSDLPSGIGILFVKPDDSQVSE
jgi:hypothetical protein